MEKDFRRWHAEKEKINSVKGTALFHEREVWWCRVGVNIGFEMDGRGETFERPVVIIKKFNLDVCLVVPLTARPKKGKYYFSVGKIADREATAVLSQIRFIDRKRLANKITMLDTKIFKKLIKEITRANLETL
ncbi:MAG: type II toxin-antitoxin system PemK/MazF family toxin [Candidatus Vogelbacteria bacterium]|nr:type II toxin-antitoxin system PemK/MazF family toxin [Candidatus Vogelbacteria bacterium]